MALNSTVYKLALQIADMDRPYYHDHLLTIARHPSETDERMMVRVLAFARHAHEHLSFGRGLGNEDEPALWQKDLTGAIDLWIDVGQPDEKNVRYACGRSNKVVIYTHGGRSDDVWWNRHRDKLKKSERLTVLRVPAEAAQGLAKLAQRSMALHCTIQDGQILMGDRDRTVEVALATLKG